MTIIVIMVLAVLLDWLVGDPVWLPHPVRWIGRMISQGEGWIRPRLSARPWAQYLGGMLLSICVVVGSFVCGWLLLFLLARLSLWLRVAVEVWFSAQLLAARSLQQESTAVLPPLQSQDLPQARRLVSRIVGRDTQTLSIQGVTKAAVETVAENTSDGIVAPLFYLLLGGMPLCLAYKAVNTLDSMIGYRNERYLWFGRFAAKLDDVANFLPARLAGILMCCCALILPGTNGRGAFRLFFRDRKNHKSPNSAQTESACAGALSVQLAGDAYYFGQLVKKPTIGDNLRQIEPEDILKACRLMYGTEVLSLLLFCLLAVCRSAVIT